MKSLTIGKWTIYGASFKQAARCNAEFKLKLAPELKDPAHHTLNIPDFGLPEATDVKEAIRLMEPHDTVFMGCFGGIGRTGTIIGCVLQHHREKVRNSVLFKLKQLIGRPLPKEFTPSDPVQWVRENYIPHAIETEAQEDFVRRFK